MAHEAICVPKAQASRWLAEDADRQEVNCPKGKRGHPGVHQCALLIAMTVVIDHPQQMIRKNYL